MNSGVGVCTTVKYSLMKSQMATRIPHTTSLELNPFMRSLFALDSILVEVKTGPKVPFFHKAF